MMLFLLSFYWLLFSILIYQWSYFKNSNVSPKSLVSILSIKIIAGLIYAYIYKHYFMSGDTLIFYEESLRIANTFFDYPEYYIQSLLGYNIAIPDADVFTYPPRAIFWKDLGTYMTIHFNAILVPFCFGIYEVQIITTAFISLCAGLNCYKVFSKYFHIPPILLTICCFLLPSLLFWTSGLHKDVFLFFSLSLAIMALEYRKLGLGILSLLLIGFTRHYYLLFIIPALCTYFFVQRRQNKTVAIPLLCIFLIGTMALAFIDYFLLNEAILHILYNKQTAFSNEIGDARIYNNVPLDSWFSLLTNLHKSLYNTIIRPHFWESKHLIHFLAGIENILILILFALPLFFRKKNLRLHEWWYTLQVLSLGFILLIGVLVANEGTIVRYRCIALSFMLIGAFECTDFQQIKAIFMLKKKAKNAKLPFSKETQKTESIS